MAFMDADAARSAAHAGQKAGEEKALNVEGYVESICMQQLFGLTQRSFDGLDVEMLSGFVERAAVPDEQPVDVRIILQQDAGRRAHEPRDMAVRNKTF